MLSSLFTYKELIIRLAKTDFLLRYQNSWLGYIWALLKPLLFFLVLNFVFSSIFNFKNMGTPFYTLELLTAFLMFNFFAEGTSSGMSALLSKGQLVTKIALPRWTLVVSSTLHSLLVFITNLVVVVGFFIYYGKMPSVGGIIFFLGSIILLYIFILACSFILAPLFVRFRDVSMIWEVLVSILMYASPIVYPLVMLPEYLHRWLLVSPLAFIIHFSKQGLISDLFAQTHHVIIMVLACIGFLVLSILLFKKTSRRIAEYI
ncbi:MAG: ABC transporter permease [Candidatus Pacebacteria bacterium]|nr:ABC transporter permease [Candidatus Paceibacterota bacterium]